MGNSYITLNDKNNRTSHNVSFKKVLKLLLVLIDSNVNHNSLLWETIKCVCVCVVHTLSGRTIPLTAELSGWILAVKLECKKVHIVMLVFPVLEFLKGPWDQKTGVKTPLIGQGVFSCCPDRLELVLLGHKLSLLYSQLSVFLADAQMPHSPDRVPDMGEHQNPDPLSQSLHLFFIYTCHPFAELRWAHLAIPQTEPQNVAFHSGQIHPVQRRVTL